MANSFDASFNRVHGGSKKQETPAPDAPISEVAISSVANLAARQTGAPPVNQHAAESLIRLRSKSEAERSRVKVSDLRGGGMDAAVEEAKRAMIAAGEQPEGVAGVSNGNTRKFRPDFKGYDPKTGRVILATPEEQATFEAPAPKYRPNPQQGGNVPTVPASLEDAIAQGPVTAEAQRATATGKIVLPEPAVSVPVEEPGEKIETAQFTAEIRQENGVWVAEIVYSNGGGTERFDAPTKNKLMKALLEGKGHATLRVREAVQREKKARQWVKLGGPKPDSYEAAVQQICEYNGVKLEDYNGAPQGARELMQKNAAFQFGVVFVKNNPEYYDSEDNLDKMLKYLDNKGWPLTARNLEIAFDDLKADDILEVRPPVAVVNNSALTTTPSTELPKNAPTAASPSGDSNGETVVVRKRGSVSGLTPEMSSVPQGGLTTKTSNEERVNAQKDLSAEEARTMPLADLQRIVRKQYKRQGA